jgi:hypothetical protein
MKQDRVFFGAISSGYILSLVHKFPSLISSSMKAGHMVRATSLLFRREAHDSFASMTFLTHSSHFSSRYQKLGLNNCIWERLGITGGIDADPPCPGYI